jgi:hypothetical protein
MSRYEVILEEDGDGNLILPLPDELFQGDRPWLIGDKLEWTVNNDSSVILTNLTWIIRNKDK